VAISDPATAHFTDIKNMGNTSIAYKPRHVFQLSVFILFFLNIPGFTGT
jgi:hypothetical protein